MKMEQSYSEGRNRPTFFYMIVLGLIVVLTVFAIVFFVKFGSLKTGFHQEQPVTKHICTFTFRAKDEFSGSWVFPEYIIKHEGKKVKDGQLFPGIKEEFSADFEDNFTVYVFDDDGIGEDYYASYKNCSCGEECIIEVKKEADVSLIVNREENNTYKVFVKAEQGYLSPYLVCLSRSFSVIDVFPESTSVLNLTHFEEIPHHLQFKVDDCFLVNQTLKDSSHSFPLHVVKDENTFDCSIDVVVVDSSFNRFFEESFSLYGIDDVVYTFNC